MEGKIIAIRPELVGKSLNVLVDIVSEEGNTVCAVLPGREKATLLPRSLLVGDGMEADSSLLSEIQEMLSKLTVGRRVRMWEYRDTMYCGFLSWSDISFQTQEESSTSVA